MNYKFSLQADAQLSAASLASIKSQLKTLGDQAGVKIDFSSVSKTSAAFKEANKQATTFGQTLAHDATKIAEWAIATGAIYGVINAIKQGIQVVIDFDKTLVNLQIATGETRDQIEQLMLKYNQMAQQLGTTTKQVADSANEYLRQGLSISDTNKMITATMYLSKLGMIDSAAATQYLTSATKGFKLSADDAIGVVDKLTAVDLNSAVNAGYLAEAMSKAATSAQLAGVDMNTLIGYIAEIGSVTQKSASTVGQSMQTVFARFGNVRSGVFSSNDADMEGLNTIETVLNSVGIKIRDTATSYRNLDDVLGDIAERWKTNTAVEKNAIATSVAGIRNRENFLTLMSNYDTALKLSTDSTNSAGTAAENMTAYEQGLEAAISSLTAAAEGLVLTLQDTGFLKGIIDTGTGALNVITKLVDTFGTLPALLTTVAAGFSLFSKKTSILNPVSLSKNGITSIFSNASAIKEDVAALTSYNNALDAGVTKQTAWYRYLQDGSETAKTAAETAKYGKVDIEAYSTSMQTLGIKAKLAAVGMNILNAALNMAIMFVVGLVIQGVVSAIDNLIHAQEKARQSAMDSAKALSEESNALEDYKKSIIELKTALDSGNLSQSDAADKRTELMRVQDEIIQKYGDEAKSIDLVNGSLNNQIALLNNISKQNAQKWLKENVTSIANAKDFLKQNKTITPTPIGIGVSQDTYDNLSEIMKSVGGDLDTTSYAETSPILDFKGTTQEIIEEISTAMDKIEDYKKSLNSLDPEVKKLNDIYTSLSDKLKELNNDETYKQNLEVYNDYIKNVAVTKYSSYYKEILDAQKKYQDAMANNDQDSIAKATEDMKIAMTDAKNAVEKDPDAKGLKDFFVDMFDSFDTQIKVFDFKKSIESNSSLKAAVESLKGLKADFTNNDLNDLGAGQKATWNTLVLEANAAGVSTENLTILLEQLGIIENTATDATEKLSGSFREFADGNSSFTETVKGWINILSDFRSSPEAISDAINGMAEATGLSAETITENLDLIRAYAAGDETAFTNLLRAELRALGVKVDISGPLSALNGIQIGAEQAIGPLGELLKLLASMGKVRAITKMVNDPSDFRKPLIPVTYYVLDTANDFGVNTNTKGTSRGSGGGSSKKDTQTYIDLLKEQLKIQEDIYDKTVDTHESTIDLIKAQIDKQQELLDALDEQYSTEDKLLELEKARQKLANIQAEKIRLFSSETNRFIWTADPQAAAEQQDVIDQLQKEINRNAEKKAIQDRIDLLGKQQEAEQKIIDQLKAKKDSINEFTDDVGLLSNAIQDNIKSWTQLISALKSAGIEFSNISGFLSPNIQSGLGVGSGASSNSSSSNSKISSVLNTLKKGSKGEDVKKLQRALNALGYSAGSIDGIFGSNTLSAVKAFQKAMGLTADGIVSAGTKAKFKLKGYSEGGGVYQTAPAMLHGSPARPEYVYSAPNVESIMSQVPTLLANMANNGGNGIAIDKMTVAANNPDDFMRKMWQIQSLGKMVPRKV